jgi:quercetin dioxygenase-like cupin family protein
VRILLGEKIREKRLEIGLNIKDLAEHTGLTPGFISQLERGLSEPSISTLRNIANSLGVAVFYFLLDDLNINNVVKKDQRRQLKFHNSQLTFELLSPDLNRQMEMFRAELLPGQASCDEPHPHTGEEVIHVLKGTMQMQVADDYFVLEEGDTIHFNPGKAHRIVNVGSDNMVFISTTTPPAQFDISRPQIKPKKKI